MSTEEQQTPTSDPLRPNVRAFKPSSFQATQFEVVTEGTRASEFAPQQFAVVQGASLIGDPMFDVYDDLVSGEPGFSGEFLTVESASFAVDIEISEETEQDISAMAPDEIMGDTNEDSASISSSLKVAAVAPTVDAPEVLASELQMLEHRFDEERLALQAEHERHLEEMKAALQQEISSQCSAESEEKVKAIEERYRGIIDDMGAQIRQEVEAVERRAVEFAIQVARKLVGTIVEINPEYILQVIQEAVKLTGGATIKAIRVSPQDLEFIKMLSPEKQFKEFDGAWSFQADDTIRAGCVVETSSGEVDCDLDKTWERIKESVTKVR